MDDDELSQIWNERKLFSQPPFPPATNPPPAFSQIR